MNKRTLRRLLGTGILFLFFATHLLPAFKSLPGIPAESFYIPIWLVTLVLIKPSIYLTREFFTAALFLVIHLLYLAIDHYDALDLSVIQTQGEIFIGVFFALSIWSYLRLEKDMKLIKQLGWIFLGGIILTCFTTILAIFNNPYAARTLIGNDNPEEVLNILRMNVGGYSFHYLLAIVCPIFIYFYKKSKKIIWLIAFIVAGLSIFYAQITAIVLIFLLNIGLTIFLLRGVSLKRYIIIWIIGVVIYLYGTQMVSQLLYFSSRHISSFELIAEKFNEVALYLEMSGEVDYSNAENVYAYKVRYELSKSAFFENPLVGGEGVSGGHHFWIDNLAEHGVIGTIPWLFVFISFLTSARKYFNREELLFVVNGLLIFIFIGLNKNILIYTMPLYPFFVVPLFLIFNKIYMEKRVSTQNQKPIQLSVND